MSDVQIPSRLTAAEELIMQDNAALVHNINPDILIEQFPLFVSRQELAKYLVKYEIFKKILNIKGSIIECGVHHGGANVFCKIMRNI